MLNNFISKSVRYTPLIISQRWKVRILPKEHYDESETKYMKTRKPGKRILADLMSLLHRKKFSLAEYRHWRKWQKIEEMRDSQRYIPERHEALGPDIATAHFIIAREGKIKFSGNDKWMSREELQSGKIPCTFIPGFFIEEVDASEMNLCYEGFDNLCNLRRLKKLNLSNCPFIDDWCLSRSYLFANTLEYLDISGCHLVTERGICTLHALKKLKTLVINDTPNIQNKEFVSLLLQDIIPACDIIGVNYSDPILLKRIEHYIH